MTIVEKFEALIASGQPFTADDVTENGALAVDFEHAANGRQSAIGALFAQASRDRRIAPTGRVKKSAAPHRKGGLIREWQATTEERLFDEW